MSTKIYSQRVKNWNKYTKIFREVLIWGTVTKVQPYCLCLYFSGVMPKCFLKPRMKFSQLV